MPVAPPVGPDTKDWTWVLTRPCPDCGFDAARVGFAEVAAAIRANAQAWAAVLATPGVTRRPQPDVWSPTEYACHVRDVHLVFAERVRLMLDGDAPAFANWDQDATAVERRYDQQDPRAVWPELVAAAVAVADVYDAVPVPARASTGSRSDGAVFTVESLARYHLHDVVHHLWDVRAVMTVAAYHAAAADYRRATLPMPAHVQAAIAELAERLGAGARVLEIGSGSGRDAAALEAAGLHVRRTDITPAFVELLRADRFVADVVDPSTDDLGDPERPGAAYDGVWANACLLHVSRDDLGVVLRRLAEATRPEGLLCLAVKEGDGEGWSTHGRVALPRMFVYWREPQLRALLDGAGWEVEHVGHADGRRGDRWLDVRAWRR